MSLLLFNKPFRVLSQFTDDAGRETLADYIDIGEVYPAGRLDYESEGLLLLTDDGRLQANIAEPRAKTPKTYWVQVEGIPSAAALAKLTQGVELKDGPARALDAATIAQPEGLWQRKPRVRVRKTVADSWMRLTIDEGRNRQVRRMTAAIDHPCLRLIRASVGPWTLGSLRPGKFSALTTLHARRMLEQARAARRRNHRP